MTLQYQGYESGEIFEATLGVRQYYLLSSTSIEQNTEFKTTDNQPAFIRTIFTGSFKYENGALVDASITDYSQQVYVTSGAEKGEVGSSLHFGNPLQRKPHELTNDTLNAATKVNYSYRSSGSPKPTGISLLTNYPVTNDRSALAGYSWASRVSEGWWNSAFNPDSSTSPQPEANSPQGSGDVVLNGNSGYGSEYADLITNFNPKENDKLQIDLSSFDGAVGKLKIAKKSKKVARLAKKDIDFIYDQQAGYLYYNENGKQPGFGDGGIFAILEGKPKAGLGNFDFV